MSLVDAIQGFSVRSFVSEDRIEVTHPDGRWLTLTREEAEMLSQMLAKAPILLGPCVDTKGGELTNG
jgi:hypothetical protein